ncbi:MAG: hypothetical protein IPM18_12510 [Phycisphaerales bacterium]|nr:hypothetical protein [Phycisphaerales bacterium]
MTPIAQGTANSLATEPHVASAAFVQAWENVRHIRNERIWFTNAYTAVVAGGLALLQRDVGTSANKLLTCTGFLVLVMFSLASLMSSIRLVAELRHSIANLQRVVTQNGMGSLVGMIEPPRGITASLPMRWVFPIFFCLTTMALAVLLVANVLR